MRRQPQYCDHCGTDTDPRARFCDSCGTPLYSHRESARARLRPPSKALVQRIVGYVLLLALLISVYIGAWRFIVYNDDALVIPQIAANHAPCTTTACEYPGFGESVSIWLWRLGLPVITPARGNIGALHMELVSLLIGVWACLIILVEWRIRRTNA